MERGGSRLVAGGIDDLEADIDGEARAFAHQIEEEIVLLDGGVGFVDVGTVFEDLEPAVFDDGRAVAKVFDDIVILDEGELAFLLRSLRVFVTDDGIDAPELGADGFVLDLQAERLAAEQVHAGGEHRDFRGVAIKAIRAERVARDHAVLRDHEGVEVIVATDDAFGLVFGQSHGKRAIFFGSEDVDFVVGSGVIGVIDVVVAVKSVIDGTRIKAGRAVAIGGEHDVMDGFGARGFGDIDGELGRA